MSFFQVIQPRKMCSTIFQNKKTLFQPIRTTGSKSRKIEIFAKGLTHTFGQKMAMCSTIFQNKKTPFQPTRTTGSKSRKIEIFAKGLTHTFGQKMAIFPCFFFGKIGQENVFYNLLEQKSAFLAYKNNTFKKSKN